MTKKTIGRPALPGGKAIHVGFTVTEELWKRFMKEAEKREVSYSELFRQMISRQLPSVEVTSK